MKIIKLLVLICIFSSCNESNNAVVMNQIGKEISVLRHEVFNGDTSAYKELKDFYRETDPSDFLSTSIFMANHHQYDVAYLDVYYCFKDDRTGLKFKERDKKTQEIMLYYLNEAAKRNVEGAKQELNNLNPSGRSQN